jgi:anaerobic magnesium-protoporphyrin IX monomethyl ester cyclase
MKMTLIFTSNELNPNFQELQFRDDSIGHVPPLSLMYVASILESEGVEVDIMDMDAEQLSYESALKRVEKFSPDLIGFTLSTYSFRPILSWIKQFKKDTGLPIIVGGAHAALYPTETMVHPEIDYLIVGEAELPLPEFIRAFKNGQDFTGLKSLAYRDKDGNVIVDKTRQAIDELDSVPWPNLTLVNNSVYSNIISKRKNFTAMLSTRGCPYKCTFCDQKTPPYRTRGIDNFVDEVVRNYHEFGVREFDIYDSTFTANKKRVKAICDRLEALNLDIGFTIRSRVDSVDPDVLDALKRGGCHTIFYGVETSDPEILRRMRKEITPERIREIVTYTKSIGIDTLGFFMFGYPGETRETMENTLQFAMDLPLDYAQFTVLTPFPDTEIYEYYLHSGLENYWAEYTMDPSKERALELIGTEVTREEVSDFVRHAYRRFYFRPRIIFDRAKKMNSAAELRSASSAAMGILKSSVKWGQGNSLFSWGGG